MRKALISMLMMMAACSPPMLRSRSTGDVLGVSVMGTVALIADGRAGAGESVDFAISPMAIYSDGDCRNGGLWLATEHGLSDGATAFIGARGKLLKPTEESSWIYTKTASSLTGDGRPECVPFVMDAAAHVALATDTGAVVRAYPFADLYVE